MNIFKHPLCTRDIGAPADMLETCSGRQHLVVSMAAQPPVEVPA